MQSLRVVRFDEAGLLLGDDMYVSLWEYLGTNWMN